MCRQTKTLKSEPVYSHGCVEEENAVVTNCIEKMRTIPVVHTTQVCSIQGTRDCLGPCYNCPVFCKKTQQSVCETTHKVTKQVITRREDKTEEPGEILIREERDVIKQMEDCYNEEIEELCAPVNCKFVNLTNTCQVRNSTMLVELKEKHCTMCESVLAEREEVKNVCREVLTDDCDSEPFYRPWKKFCSDKQDDMKKFVEDKDVSFVKEKPRSQDITAKKVFLFNTFDPVISSSEAAVEKENKQNQNQKLIVDGKPIKLSEVDRELIKLVKSEEELIHEEFDLIKELKSLPTNMNVNVKYNLVTSQTTPPHPKPTTTLDPILHFLETEISLPNDTDKTDSNPSSQIQKPDIHVKEDKLHITTDPINYTQKSVQHSINEEHHTINTERDKEVKRKPIKAKENLSASDFLRLCFSSGIGCDFNQNNLQKEILTTEPNTTPRLESTSTTPTPFIISTESSSSIMERLRQRVKLCFFSSICNDPGDQSVNEPIIRQPRVISAQITERPQKEKTKSRSNKIRAQIQARAKACFYEGKCN